MRVTLCRTKDGRHLRLANHEAAPEGSEIVEPSKLNLEQASGRDRGAQWAENGGGRGPWLGPGQGCYGGIVKIRDLIRLVESDGWKHVRTTGSHRHFKHPSKPNVVTIPGHPNHDVPVGTLKSILKAAGLEEGKK